MSGKLTPAQHAQLLKPINPVRVFSANGQSHVPAYDVAAHLTRIFGFGGWDKEILSLERIVDEKTQTKNGRDAYSVTYSCTLRLTVRDEQGNVLAMWEDGACGSSTQPQHGEALDMAMKSAISYALKRCAAFGLGDQFGLSLYNKGMVGKLIGQTLVGPEIEATADANVEQHAPVPESMGNDETESVDVDPDTGVINTPAPAAPAPTEAPAPAAEPASVPDGHVHATAIKNALLNALATAQPDSDYRTAAIQRWGNFERAHGVSETYPKAAADSLIAQVAE